MTQIDLAAALSALRAKAPLVHNITNFVAMTPTANALLALGASPAMVHAIEEVADFAPIASALVINIGTLAPDWVDAMAHAASAANAAGVPWVLDPVAAGATPLRRAASRRLLDLEPAIVRGNGSEIMALAGEAGGGKGVDSTAASDDACNAAIALARATSAVVAVTGRIDYVTDGSRTAVIENGDPLLTRVTATGCSATAIIGAYLGAGLPALDAAVAGLVTLGVAGEIAARASSGPGSFQVALFDALAALDPATLARGGRVKWST
jgi:hydroxyethylthiazole kinase